MTFTLYSSKDPLSKTYFLKDGKVNKQAAAQMTTGTAERVTIPFADFANVLTNANNKQAAGFGVHGLSHPDKVKIAIASKADTTKGLLARTKEYYLYSEGGGILMLDHDPSEYGPSFTPEDFIKALAAIHPAIGQAARIVRGSVSAGVHKEGEGAQTDKGFHVYIPVNNAGDIRRYGKVLFDRCWLADHGFIALAKNGAMLNRSPIDAAVFSPERLDFIAPPIINGLGLAYTPPEIDYAEGGALDTATLLDLTADELQAVKELQAKAKQAIRPQSEAVLDVWKDNAINAHVAQGKSLDDAQRLIDGIVKGGFKDLYGDYILEFTTGPVSVAEALANGKAFEGKALADPIEGKAYGATTAKFYLNQKDKKPFINSNAHGGQQYFLHSRLPKEEQPQETGGLDRLNFNALNIPCFIVKDDCFEFDGKRKPGVYWCYEKESNGDVMGLIAFVCSPLYIEAVTNTEDGRFFGRLLRFRTTLGKWREWAMPMEMLRGSCEELRGELLAAGVEIDQRNKIKLADYLQAKAPKDVVTAATKTGWTAKGGAFVLYDKIIGDEKVHFQSESLSADGAARTGGDYMQWQSMAALCEGNPVLMVSLCVSMAGPLLAKVHRDSGGVHWVGDSSIGKTTALCVGASVWGGDDFKRTWRATSNGLEGVAALLSDTCLCLDEISEADPREVGAIVYSLGNGVGKTRANRIGSARQAARWRLSLLSTGERSIGAAMQEGGKVIKAGQLVRLLNIPAARQFGVFDDLHTFADGRALADHFKDQCAKHYGHAGIKLVEHIISLGNADFGAILAAIEAQFIHSDSQAARTASRFALYAMAGELAIEAGILPWKVGAALTACQAMFTDWQTMQGTGATEHNQIIESVNDYILKYGESKFSSKDGSDDAPRIDRSGWLVDRPGGRIYLFTSAALKDAGGNYDFKRVLDSLDSEGWIVERDTDKRSKKTAIPGGSKQSLYWLQPTEIGNRA